MSSATISNKQIMQALEPFRISLSPEQIGMVREYINLLLKWNRSISLTSVTNIDEIITRHFGESMFGGQLVPVENCRLADVGTGPGFPGLPLKIFAPSLDLLLFESNKKKSAFLSEVVRTLGLSGVEVFGERFEDTRPEDLKLDVITARALGDFKQLLQWSSRALTP